MASPERFSAFLDGSAWYIDWDKGCGRCGEHKRRVRDRSCYGCHLRRGRDAFEQMKAGISPKTQRSRAGHLDVLERQQRERSGEHIKREFDGLVATRWPTGRLEVTFPDGWHEPDMSKVEYHGMRRAISDFPQLARALEWAGWTIPYLGR